MALLSRSLTDTLAATDSVTVSLAGPAPGYRKASVNGQTTVVDRRGNPPNLAFLEFATPEPSVRPWVWINVWARGENADVLVDRSREVGRDPYYRHWHALLCAVHGEKYVVDWEDRAGNRSARLETPDPWFVQGANVLSPTINVYRTNLEHVRRVYKVAEEAGERCHLLRRKQTGTRCVCWDRVTEKPVSTCEECFGVGFDGGYDLIHDVLCRFQPGGQRVQLTEVGVMVDTQPRGWMPPFPHVEDGDVLVRMRPQKTLARYEINNVTRQGSEGGIGGVPTIQEFSLRLHNAHNPVYKFPMPENLGFPEVRDQSGLVPRGE